VVIQLVNVFAVIKLSKSALLLLLLTALVILGGAGDATPSADFAKVSAPSSESIPVYSFEVINSWPHDPKAFTQGLIFHDGYLLESTGRYGESTLRRVELESGKVKKKTRVDEVYFAEGLTLFGDRLYQLTWTAKKGFIYGLKDFNKIGEFSYAGEGWGLTNDGTDLILSDGTSTLRFLDPATFNVVRTIKVVAGEKPVKELNELEYVKGEIWSNIWHSDRIARIDPANGNVVGWIDLSGLLPAESRSEEEAVLNGIAYDAKNDRIFVTGKLWPKIFEIRLKNK
jgi:glutamine cyclotransferase